MIAVQEACSRDGEDQVTQLARDLGYHHASHHHPEAPDLGLGALSRWPLRTLDIVALPAGDGPQEHRAALAVTVDTPVGPRAIYVTHLNWRRDQGHIRHQQLATILRHVADHTDPTGRAMVCGDLNAEPTADEIRMMTGLAPLPVPGVVFDDVWTATHADTDPGHTWSHRNPHAAAERWGNSRLDYIFLCWQPTRSTILHAEVVDGQHDGTWGSDHCGLLATLDLS